LVPLGVRLMAWLEVLEELARGLKGLTSFFLLGVLLVTGWGRPGRDFGSFEERSFNLFICSIKGRTFNGQQIKGTTG